MLECSIPVYELLEHEHKLGVCNFSFEAWQDYEKPIINKEQIIVQYGPRRQIIQPLYNQANNNPNNVHKLENFVHHNQGGGGAIIATAITPVLFTNSPTLFFKIHPDADDSSNSNGGSVEFVGKGTYLGSDAKRIMVQRVVLTGHPIKFINVWSLSVTCFSIVKISTTLRQSRCLRKPGTSRIY